MKNSEWHELIDAHDRHFLCSNFGFDLSEIDQAAGDELKRCGYAGSLQGLVRHGVLSIPDRPGLQVSYLAMLSEIPEGLPERVRLLIEILKRSKMLAELRNWHGSYNGAEPGDDVDAEEIWDDVMNEAEHRCNLTIYYSLRLGALIQQCGLWDTIETGRKAREASRANARKSAEKRRANPARKRALELYRESKLPPRQRAAAISLKLPAEGLTNPTRKEAYTEETIRYWIRSSVLK